MKDDSNSDFFSPSGVFHRGVDPTVIVEAIMNARVSMQRAYYHEHITCFGDGLKCCLGGMFFRDCSKVRGPIRAASAT